MDHLLSPRLRELRGLADEVARDVITPRAAEVDRDALWPAHALRAMGDAGLMGLLAPRASGGAGEGLVGLVAVTEAIARAGASAAMCYGMHCVATAVIAAKATANHRSRYLEPIAGGRHISSLALSESGMGASFYVSQTSLRRDGDAFVVDGEKQFITNGGHADSYVVSTMASDPAARLGESSCLIVDGDTPGLDWLEPWLGLGMRGNSSRGLRIRQARVPIENLLGEDGDQTWYVFEVIVPSFLLAMSAVYLGVARAALDETIEHLKGREITVAGAKLSEVPALQLELAEMWAAVEACRLLVFDAARRGDEGQDALTSILTSKAVAAETVVAVTNQAMTLCGGIAYRENARLAQLLRDARASHVMAPTTHMLKQWTARRLLGLPLL
jgi:isovaleryl-CoA dehydrogenase